ncbi:hypothetical protein D3C78_1271730 [compost metagenome]
MFKTLVGAGIRGGRSANPMVSGRSERIAMAACGGRYLAGDAADKGIAMQSRGLRAGPVGDIAEGDILWPQPRGNASGPGLSV